MWRSDHSTTDPLAPRPSDWQGPSMEFSVVAAAYLETEPVTSTTSAGPDLSPARRLRDALEPIATQGWWARDVHEHPGSGGLGFLETYVWGRAAALGEPAADVVTAAFGVFEPGLVAALLGAGREAAPRDDILTAREEGAVAALRRVLGDEVEAPEVGELTETLLSALDAQDGLGRPLFSGLRGLPRPSDPAGRLWRAAELFREHRGDGHLAACAVGGLGAVAVNVLTELWHGYPLGEYSSTRGFPEDVIAVEAASLRARGWLDDTGLTAQGQRARAELEAATDASQRDLVAALDDVDALVAVAEPLSARLVAARAAPVDARKRAAG